MKAKFAALILNLLFEQQISQLLIYLYNQFLTMENFKILLTLCDHHKNMSYFKFLDIIPSFEAKVTS